ncbi:hypothetical protein TSAR_007141 [Trichomalopsis sarcophagae]|uniref:Uncharacterized protein n=1 Tax=Trichomalopsis sarcophagae TaxID=543379 RepID=A0A232EEC8_9HYME|nr:hypothetical protein TSAR_007141 [Trichomalopsis sarcophagae]
MLKVTNDEFDVCFFALSLVKLFRNSLPSYFSLNCLSSTMHPECYGFGIKKMQMRLYMKVEFISARMNSTQYIVTTCQHKLSCKISTL